MRSPRRGAAPRPRTPAALALAHELGRRRGAKGAMAAAAAGLRGSPGGGAVFAHLTGLGVAFRAQVVAGDAARAVVLRDQLSPEIRDALVAS